MKTTMFVASALAAAVTLAGCGTAQPVAQVAQLEKCYGVAQAGKNDCAGVSHACAGQSGVSKAAVDFVNVPAGTCDKLVGGVAG
ncbi:MAG: BufA1 family periplasmic bufferin-type metallophore [Dongiaceae bacterium]